MVAVAEKLEVRAVGAADFDAIAPLLDLFGNTKMSHEDWRAMLFTYPWWHGSERGFALYADGVAVGFLGTIFSNRTIDGRRETFCNTSSWIVREPYRSASIALLKPILALRDCTIVNWTPTERSYDIFKKLGFRPLETESLLLPPLAPPASFLGSFTHDPERLVPLLSAAEREIYRDLAAVRPNVAHVVLRRKRSTCYVVATRRMVRGVAVADVHYISDRALFWSLRGLAHVALWRVLGAYGMSVDRRFAPARAPRIALRRTALRLYRPANPQTPPEAIDGLFSEMMTLRL